MAKLFANSGDLDQMPHSVASDMPHSVASDMPRSAASDLGLHCLPVTLLQVSRLQQVKKIKEGKQRTLY